MGGGALPVGDAAFVGPFAEKLEDRCMLSNVAPTANDATFSAAEDAAMGTSVGTVSASDPNGDTLSYSITAGNIGDAFMIDALTGEIMAVNALDFETTPTYTLSVQVTDDGIPALSDTATITVNLTDVNDAPVLDNTGNMTLTDVDEGEANPPGDTVAAIIASAGGDRITDPDTGLSRALQ